MKAIAVHPGVPNSIHLRDIAEPQLTEIPDGRGVKVEVLRVGVDGTDKEINAAEYGAASPGDDLIKAEALFPGWLGKLLTTPVHGLENYDEMIRRLTEERDAIKVYVEVAPNGRNST